MRAALLSVPHRRGGRDDALVAASPAALRPRGPRRPAPSVAHQLLRANEQSFTGPITGPGASTEVWPSPVKELPPRSGGINTVSFCIMPSLHVRNIPDDLYAALRASADTEGRSLSAQTVAILRRALADSLVDRAGVAQRIAARRRSAGVMSPSATDLVREDRDR